MFFLKRLLFCASWHACLSNPHFQLFVVCSYVFAVVILFLFLFVFFCCWYVLVMIHFIAVILRCNYFHFGMVFLFLNFDFFLVILFSIQFCLMIVSRFFVCLFLLCFCSLSCPSRHITHSSGKVKLILQKKNSSIWMLRTYLNPPSLPLTLPSLPPSSLHSCT